MDNTYLSHLNICIRRIVNWNWLYSRITGSETQFITLIGIGMKQIGQSSFAGGSLNSASRRVARQHVACILFFLCSHQWSLWHMALAVLRVHTRRTRLPHLPHQQLFVVLRYNENNNNTTTTTTTWLNEMSLDTKVRSYPNWQDIKNQRGAQHRHI
jgi:hypothetical protein